MNSYQKCKQQIEEAIHNLSPTGKLFKLTSTLSFYENIIPTNMESIITKTRGLNVCKDLLKELNDAHLQSKP